MHHAVTLDALRVLVAIDEKGSFAAAAQSLFKVPSALTYTVRKLEDDLGVTLFDREGGKARLTQAGQQLLQDGKALLLAASRLEDRLRQSESGWEPRLIIAKDTIIPDQPLLALLQGLCGLDKAIDVQWQDEALGGGWDALHSERADLALGVTGEPPGGNYRLEPMGELSWVFAVALEHPLADTLGTLSSQQVADFPAIVVADSSRALPLRSSGLFDSKQVIRVPSMQAKLAAQKAGLGVGFLPLHLARQALDEGTLIAKSTELHRPSTPVYAACQRNKRGLGLAWLMDNLTKLTWLSDGENGD
ncbi:LysR family transcriptional regulator [Aestuariibacter halophilus]|uniref:LysR family transcriptional regulator n=1 Tax=Fluctibacter halophilus TaxID=226011 RepID=A0ABS8GAE5_9ALTE|nr:LysR family transcriptional regulator [Aestuariibacter halophilus]MCC2617141.1 LysR family transcriptional regulator [Aestuariibacter halophilus]